jgi:hypothetical protein
MILDGLDGRDVNEWKAFLGDCPRWLRHARVDPGKRGVRPATWNPVLFLDALRERREVPRSKIKALFRTSPELAPWVEHWQEHETMRDWYEGAD